MGRRSSFLALFVLLALSGPGAGGLVQRSTVRATQDVDTSDDVAYLMSFMRRRLSCSRGIAARRHRLD
jgi:hypothetical protein